MPWHHQPGAWA